MGELEEDMEGIILSMEHDTLEWELANNKKFTTASLYDHCS